MEKIRSKQELYEWLLEMRVRYEDNLILVGFIDELSYLYLSNFMTADDPKSQEDYLRDDTRLFNDMKKTYFNFSETVVGLPAIFDASDAKALTNIREYIKKLVKLKNQQNGVIETQAIVNHQVSLAWKVILRYDNWKNYPQFIQNLIRLRQMQSYMSNILNELRKRMRSSHEGISIAQQKEQEIFKDLLRESMGKHFDK
uniref:Uncharacterized protein n=1 Tax=viral metagenome TaxID=1070528 RepID=A0A6M3KCY9_9ZZZZ